MARYPKFKEAKLTIFNNSSDIQNQDSNYDSFEEMMGTHGEIVCKFSIEKDISRLAAIRKTDNKTSKNWYGFCRAWLKFEDEKTIHTSLNVVLKKASELLNNGKKFQIDKEYNRKIRRSHMLWVAKTMRVGEFSSSYHSCMINSITGNPIGFISLAKRDNGVIGYITQDFDGKVKHIINVPDFTKSAVVVGQFRYRNFVEMMGIIDDVEGEQNKPKKRTD